MPRDCGMPEMVFCVVCPEDHQPSLADINSAEPTPFRELSPKVLKVQCASVAWNPPLYRKGLGTAMLYYLVDWARENGWERIEGWAFENPSVDDAYVWIPSVQFWEKAGARRGSVPAFEEGDPNIGKPACKFVIDLN